MTVLPERYQPALGLYETQKAIGLIKNIFQVKLCAALHLKRVTAPLFVDPATGLNDDLNGVERPVGFDIPAVGIEGQVVHSLAKWKRLALHDYNFFVGNGLVADMNAIRRDEELDNLHSIYVDQWDWEKVIDESTRNEAYLKDTVRRIVSAICGTLDELKWQFSRLDTDLCRDVFFITAQELEDMYPQLTPKEREGVITKKHKTVFIQQIGGKLKSGKPHDGRAPDYDDWSLNGDLLFWHEPLQCALEISSMGIRVDPESLDKQLSLAGCDNRRELPFHKMLLNGELPPDHRRGHRPKPPVHAAAGQGPYRRGPGLPVGRGDKAPLQGSGHRPAVRSVFHESLFENLLAGGFSVCYSFIGRPHCPAFFARAGPRLLEHSLLPSAQMDSSAFDSYTASRCMSGALWLASLFCKVSCGGAHLRQPGAFGAPAFFSGADSLPAQFSSGVLWPILSCAVCPFSGAGVSGPSLYWPCRIQA